MKQIKQIKTPTEILPWFNKANYIQVLSLHPREWYEQLLIRKILFGLLEYPDVISQEVKEAINFLRNKPIIEILKDKPLFIFKPYFTQKNPIYPEGVHALTLQEFIKLESLLPSNKSDYAKKWHTSNHLNLSILCDPLVDCISEPISQLTESIARGNEILSVDCSQPLPLLVKCFEQHIKIKKKELKTKKNARYKFPTNYDCFRFGVLPYLDIQLWKMETGNKFSNEELLAAITPDTDTGDLNTLRTTRSLANKLLTHKHLESLASLAKSEKI